MSRVEKKLKSERGASITFALLLFLVCAVVSSIVIVAATAASGRMSKLAEMDQRYYSVTSAVKLLEDTLDGQSVIVKRSEKTNTTYTADNPSMTGETRGEDLLVSDITRYIWPDKSESEPVVVFVNKKEDDDITENLSDYKKWLITRIAHGYSTTSDKDPDIPLTPTPPSSYILAVGANEDLKCDVLIKMETDGLVTFTVKNHVEGVSSEDQFTLNISFLADVEVVEGTRASKGTREKTDAGYQRIDSLEKTTTTRVTLNLIGVDREPSQVSE